MVKPDRGLEAWARARHAETTSPRHSRSFLLSAPPRVNPASPADTPPAAPAVTRYFVKLETKDRAPWLAAIRTREIILAVLRSWHGERHGRILCANVLPDVVYILLELAEGHEITQVIAGWKAATRRAAGYAETFQQEFGGHRLWTADEAEDCALYIFAKPYRARLLAPDEVWPAFWAPDSTGFRFMTSLNPAGGPATAWLAWPDDRFEALTHGV